MHSLWRSGQLARQTSKSHCPTLTTSRRAFSGSAACQRGSLPQFLEPSSAQLTTLLSQLNQKVLLPAHLNKEQQDLVYKKANRARLEAEPINITLGDVTLPLEHIDRIRDVPRRWHIIRDVVRNSSTANDYENVLRMMEGFREAAIHLQAQWQEMIIRKLNEAGQDHLVLKALQRADKTGLKLQNKSLVDQVLNGLHEKALKSDFDKNETEKALKFAEQVVELMEDKQHVGGQHQVGVGDPRTNPLVICVPTTLAAIWAKRNCGGEDKDGKVKRYAGRLMNAVHQNDFRMVHLPKLLDHQSLRADSTSDRTPYRQKREVQALQYDLRRLVPFWGALKTSIAILGSDMPMLEDAKKIEKDVRDELDKGTATLTKLKTNGFDSGVTDIEKIVRMYEEI